MIKVLIIEDHKVTRDGLRSALQEFTELEISGATADSVSGLRLAEELQPDVVLLDLHLPGPLGPRNLVEKMKSSVNAKIVVFSAENRAVIIRAVLDAKADAFVYKAAEPQEIYSAIKDVMEGTVGGRYGVVEDPTCEPVFTAGERHILSPPDLTRLPLEVETQIYRIMQESLNNVEKHAQASVVRFEIELSVHSLHFTVIDDGLGLQLSAPSAHTGGSGKKIMRERTQFISHLFPARLSMQQLQPTGTSISLVIDLPGEDSIQSEHGRQARDSTV